MGELFSWEVSVKGKEDWGQIINARSSGQAKSEYFSDLLDSWPEIPFTLLRCRKVGAPNTSEQFVNNARYRGLPDVKCGQRVKVGEAFGVIVGHNASANFDVLFDEDSKYRGSRINVHPNELQLVS